MAASHGVPPRSARSTARTRAARGLSALAVALLAAGCTGSDSPAATPSPSAPPAAGAGSAPAGTGGLEQVPEVAARVAPGVVTVLAGEGLGSGVIYTADGLIITNEHVVRGATDVQVAFADGQRVAGTVTATDPVTDLALVQADRRDLPAVTFQTDLPVVGSLAVVVGNPLGFESTVTAGVISGLHREIPGSATQSQALVDLIQTDAPISPGSSGGALVNAAGEVTGISVAYIPPSAGAVALGFAIPAATAVDIADQLRRTGRAQHAYAGLVPAPITPQIAERLGLPGTKGVIVAAVAAGGPAASAGLAPGDVITAIDGEPTGSPEELLAALRGLEPGDTVDFTVRPPGQGERQVQLTLIDRPVVSGR